MPTPETHGSRRPARLGSSCLTATLLTLVAAAGACSSSAAFERDFAIDGDVAEWPNREAAIATENYLYLRFRYADAVQELRTPDSVTRILLDIDGEPTGLRLSEDPVLAEYGPVLPPELANLGVDVELRLSPPMNEGDAPSAEVVGYEIDGTPTSLDALGVQFEFGPTYASDWYELRLDRTGASDWLLAQPGRAGGVYITQRDGTLIGASEPIQFRLPRGYTPEPQTADIPERQPGGEQPQE